MAFYGYPRPDDTSDMPSWVVWRNYVTVQATAACVGLIPPHTYGIRVLMADDGWSISLEFQLTKIIPEDVVDMETICHRLRTRIADTDNKFNVTWSYIIVDLEEIAARYAAIPPPPASGVDPEAAAAWINSLMPTSSGGVAGIYHLNHRLTDLPW